MSSDDSGDSAERLEHFYVMVEQLLDGARIGGVLVRLTLRDGSVVDGIPLAPTSASARDDQVDDSVVRQIALTSATVDMADVREATILRPRSPA